ncbi:hypothetical protein AB0C81_18785 [Streptomyces roseoverticillatus]|uniref:hypothetical protein n=1 Tax=Streptomyces roseoverticillatus TaxID=66429 RepID=UPI0033EA2CDA
MKKFPVVIICATSLLGLSACSSSAPSPKADAGKPSAPLKAKSDQGDVSAGGADFSKMPEVKEEIERAEGKGLSGRSIDFGGPFSAPDILGELPSPRNPGAVFSLDEYRRIAELPNEAFMDLRRKVMASSASSAVKASFASNGCTGVFSFLLTPQDWRACVQHDFRYTVGPNTIDEPDAQEADQEEADKQMAGNVQSLFLKAAPPFFKALRATGVTNYTQTPTIGEPIDNISTVINSEAVQPDNGRGEVDGQGEVLGGE